MPSSKSLPSSGAESEIERMTNLEKFGLQPYTLGPTKSKIPVGYGRISGSDLASSNDVAKTWGKCECCAPMETSIEGACCLHRVWTFVDQIHILCYDSLGEKTSLVVWFSPNADPWQIRIKVFYLFKLRDYRFL